MQQHHSARVDARHQLLQRRITGGLLVGIPIDVRKAPEHGGIAQILCHGQVGGAAFALRRPVQFDHLLPGQFPVGVFQLLQLGGKGLRLLDGRHIRVRPGVVAHHVPLLHHAAHQLRRRFHIMPHDKEAGADLMLAEGIENGGGMAVFIPRVKGQVQNLLLGIGQIPGVILCQIRAGRVADRRLAVFPKTQAPVADGIGCRGRRRLPGYQAAY